MRVRDELDCSATLTINLSDSDAPELVVNNLQNATCFGDDGSASLEVANGAVEPLMYRWSHDVMASTASVSNLPAGMHTVTVTDTRGCSVTETFDIGDEIGPTALTATVNEPALCGLASGRLELATADGTAPFRYSWSHDEDLTGPLAENLAGGSYTVEVTDANDCSLMATFEVADSPAIALAVDSLESTSCGLDNGYIRVLAEDFTTPLRYAWSHDAALSDPIAEGLAAGDYSLTVTDANDCSATLMATIEPSTDLVLNFPADTALCRDGIMVLDLAGYSERSVTGPGGFSSTDEVILLDAAGQYTITASSGSGCSATKQLNLSFTNTSFVAGMVLPSDVVIADSVVVLETSWPAPETVSWFWDRPGATLVLQRQNQYFYLFDEVGDYQLSLIAGLGGCEDLITKNITVHPDSTTIPSVNLNVVSIEDIVVSPNPNDGQFTVSVRLSDASRIFLQLYSLDGIPLERREGTGLSEYSESYNLNLESGSYLMLVQTPFARRTVRIIVN